MAEDELLNTIIAKNSEIVEQRSKKSEEIAPIPHNSEECDFHDPGKLNPSLNTNDYLESNDNGASNDRSKTNSNMESNDHLKDITDVIYELSGNRSSKDFFVSILLEKSNPKTFLINVIDKKSGQLLGHLYANEKGFHKARSDGVFDNFLSLFMLNSLESYTDFVRLANNPNKNHL